MQTALNLKTFNEGGKVGQKIHAICLEGPPGAGKSFYATTYTKLAEKLFNEPIEFISYQCNAATGKADLYEEINVSAAIAGDKDKVIISGKLVEAIEKVNEGKKVILFIDEYDKSRTEVDSFFYNFLQDGEIDTNQKGKIKVKYEYLKNLQVIICKNDERDLALALSRRFKKITLDYMKPDILAITMNRVLKNSNATIRDAITLLYTAMYKTLEGDSKYHFSRLPACSECMQAVIDTEDLMEIGANETDIVVTGIYANLIKNEDDAELFKVFLQENNNSQFIEWYNRIIEATGRNNTDDLDNLKRALAESFYPEQLRELTGEIEKTKRDLENQKELLNKRASEFDARKVEIQKAQEVLDSRKKELDEREKETETLRKNAYEDAKKEADSYLTLNQKELEDKLNLQEEEMERDYRNRFEDLKRREEETNQLRANAQQDALQNANQIIEDERKKMEQMVQQREVEFKNRFKQESIEINDQIKGVNEQIQRFNYKSANFTSLQEELLYKEAEIKKYRVELEKLLGRKINESDWEQEEQEILESVKMKNGEEIVSQGFQDFINGEIQKNTFQENNETIMKYFQQNIFSVGVLVLEEKENKESFSFKDENNKTLLLKLMDKHKRVEEICEDGVVLYKDDKIVIVGIRVIEQTQTGNFKSVYKFFSNSIVIPIHALGRINTLISNIKKAFCGTEIKYEKPIEMKIECLIASDKEHKNSDGCIFERCEENIYRLQYANISNFNLNKMAIQMHEVFNCSEKEMTSERKALLEEIAFIKHCQYIQDANVIDKIKPLNVDDLYSNRTIER